MACRTHNRFGYWSRQHWPKYCKGSFPSDFSFPTEVRDGPPSHCHTVTWTLTMTEPLHPDYPEQPHFCYRVRTALFPDIEFSLPSNPTVRKFHKFLERPNTMLSGWNVSRGTLLASTGSISSYPVQHTLLPSSDCLVAVVLPGDPWT